MTEYNLTPQQKELLITIVEQMKSGKAQEPLIPVISHSGSSLIGIQGEFGRNLLGDLEALSDEDLLGFRYNSKGNKIYTVKQSAYDAVEKIFEKKNPISNIERKQVFISYSHVDQVWLRRLKTHLRPFERDYKVDVWDDTKINTGQDWKNEIKKALDKTKVAVLLVSADFLASDFIATDELPPLLKAAEQGGAVIMPIVLKPCSFLRIDSLSRFQAVNSPFQTLIEISEGEQERFLLKLTDDILSALQNAPK